MIQKCKPPRPIYAFFFVSEWLLHVTFPPEHYGIGQIHVWVSGHHIEAYWIARWSTVSGSSKGLLPMIVKKEEKEEKEVDDEWKESEVFIWFS